MRLSWQLPFSNLQQTANLDKISHQFLIGSISSFLILNSGKDCKGWRSQFRSVAKEWSDSGTLKSLFFAKQKATQRLRRVKAR